MNDKLKTFLVILFWIIIFACYFGWKYVVKPRIYLHTYYQYRNELQKKEE